MFVGKRNQSDLSGDLTVDQWSTNYISEGISGGYSLTESYEGKAKLEKVNQWKYLGFIISNSKNNLPNIREIKRKSIGTVKKILDRLKCLNLYQNYFECSIIFDNIMLSLAFFMPVKPTTT